MRSFSSAQASECSRCTVRVGRAELCTASRAKAEAVYKSGIARKTRPVGVLEDAYAKFLARDPAAGAPATATASSSTAAPAPTAPAPTAKSSGLAVPAPAASGSKSLNSSASDTFIAPGPSATADERAAYKRLTYMRQHVRSAGAPAPGKRREVLMFDLPSIFTPEGVEYSFEEVRARGIGLLDKKWPAPEPWEYHFRSKAAAPAAAPARAPGVKFAETATTHEDDASFASTVSGPASPRHSEQPVNFDGGLGGAASRTTVLRRMGGMGAGFGADVAEPTMTINTKESLADVYGMMNSPEKTMRSGALPGSKYAPVKRIELNAVVKPVGAMTSLAALTGGNAGFQPFEDDGEAALQPFVDDEAAVAGPKIPAAGPSRPALTPCMRMLPSLHNFG
jgi:checkpoint serine/threonine-protein kinase